MNATFMRFVGSLAQVQRVDVLVRNTAEVLSTSVGGDKRWRGALIMRVQEVKTSTGLVYRVANNQFIRYRTI